MIYIGTYGHVSCVDPQTGREVWRTALTGTGLFGGTSVGDVTVLEAGDIIIAGVSGNLFGIDKASGRLLWHNELKGLSYGVVSIAGAGQAVEFMHRVEQRSS